MRLGEVIQKWRLWQERNIRDLAAEIGISPSTLSRIERGERMDAPTFMKILNWLTAEPAQAEEPPAAVPVQETML